MLYTKIQPLSFGSGVDFLPCMGMAATLFNGVKPLEKYPFDRRPHVKSGENCSSSFREEN